MSIQEEKQALRAKLRAEMQLLPPAYFHSAGEAICRRILEGRAYRQAKTVFCFVSHGREPDTYPLLKQALQDGKTLCVPLCLSPGVMKAVQITALSQLAPGAYGIPEPPADAPVLSPSEIDLALIPCLAAARDGRRLGKGGGYYDRFLSGFQGHALLLCPEKLLQKSIPTEPHDIHLSCIITEKEALP